MYKIKYHTDGTVERFKARLVTLGNHQVEGVDYHETFAPVAKMVTVCILLTLVVAKGWSLHEMDVHNAFLHGGLHEDIYMTLPPGFHTTQCGMQAQKVSIWSSASTSTSLHLHCMTMGSNSPHSIIFYLDSQRNGFLALLIYVNDLVLIGKNPQRRAAFKTYLNKCFKLKDLGPLKYFLGIEVARASGGVFLCQQKHTLDILTETGMWCSKPSSFSPGTTA